MENKIYEKIEEEQIRNMNKFIKRSAGKPGNKTRIHSITQTKNYDLEMLLAKLGLIKPDTKNFEIIDEFNEYLTKYGIELGLSSGKKLAIEHIQEGKIPFERIMKINTENYGKQFSSVPVMEDWR